MDQVVLAFSRVVFLTFVCGSADAAIATAENGVEHMDPGCYSVTLRDRQYRVATIEKTITYVHRPDGKILEVAEVYLAGMNQKFFSAGEVELILW